MRINTVVYGLALVLERLVSFLLLPILTKTISISDYAVWAQSVVVVGVSTPIILLGFQTALIKYTPFWVTGTPKNNSLLFAMVLGVLIMAGTISSFMVIFADWTSNLIFGQSKYAIFIPMLAGLMCSEALFDFLISYMRANGLINRIAIYFVLKSLGRFCIFLISFRFFQMSFQEAYLTFVIIQAIFIGLIFGLDFPLKQVFYSSLFFSRPHWQEVISFSFPLVVLALLTASNNFIDRIFLAHFMGLKVVAEYSVAYSLAAIGSFFYSVLGFTLFPELTRRWAAGNVEDSKKLLSQALSFYLVFILPFVGSLVFVGPYIIGFLATEAYVLSNCVITLLGCSIGLFGVYQILFYVTLLNRSSSNAVINMGVAAFFNMVVNIALIPAMGALGAAIAGVFSNFILVLMTWINAKKIINLKLPWITFAHILFRAFMVVIFLWVGSIWPGYNESHKLVIVLLSAAAFYLLLDLLDKNNSTVRKLIS